jgi:hypothetical protein
MSTLLVHTDTDSDMKLLKRVLDSSHFLELLQIYTDEAYSNSGDVNLEFGSEGKYDALHFYVSRKLTEEDL